MTALGGLCEQRSGLNKIEGFFQNLASIYQIFFEKLCFLLTQFISLAILEYQNCYKFLAMKINSQWSSLQANN